MPQAVAHRTHLCSQEVGLIAREHWVAAHSAAEAASQEALEAACGLDLRPSSGVVSKKYSSVQLSCRMCFRLCVAFDWHAIVAWSGFAVQACKGMLAGSK